MHQGARAHNLLLGKLLGNHFDSCLTRAIAYPVLVLASRQTFQLTGKCAACAGVWSASRQEVAIAFNRLVTIDTFHTIPTDLQLLFVDHAASL